MIAKVSRLLLVVSFLNVIFPLCGTAAAAPPIRWRGGAAYLATASLDRTEAVLAAASSDGARSPHIILQFDRIPDEVACEQLAAQGVTLLSHLGDRAYFAAVRPGFADPAKLARTRGLVGIGGVQLEWKLHPAFTIGPIPDWAVVRAPKDGVRLVAVCAMFHADVDLKTEAIPLAESSQARVRDRILGINGLMLELPEEQIVGLAAADAVQWLEPPLPKMEPLNDGARTQAGVDIVQAAPYELTGDGVCVLVFDSGTVRSTHVDFQGRVAVGDSSGMYFHPTHVAGTIGGAGVANPTYRGMAPGVTMLSYGFEGGNLYSNPGDIEGDYRRAIEDGAVISNNSIGVNVETSGYPCSWQGDYNATDAVIDNLICGSLGSPFRVVWAGGNERQGSRCDVEGYGDYYSVPPPCGAKNHITVGAVNSNDASMTTFSSWGPTDDGRLKPTICAPGCQTGGDGGIKSCTSTTDTAYASYCGTSQAAPVVTGLSALLIEDFRNQFPGQPLPRNATLKAIFAQTATDLGNVGPDYMYGYGLVNAPSAIDLLRASGFTEDSVTQGLTRSRTMTVAPEAEELRITLAWDDAPGTPNVSPSLVNDLDLRVFGPGGTRYYPWTLDPFNPSAPAIQTLEDHLNNLEQVFVQNPTPGEWTIEVYGGNVPQGPQPFSLAGDGAFNVVTLFAFPDGRPGLISPGATFDLDVAIICFNNSLVPGTESLHYRVDGSSFEVIPLTELSPGQYRVTLPACLCGETPEYYFSVETTALGLVTEPASAPSSLHGHEIGSWAPFFADDLEEDSGWTIFAGAYSGNWERADPAQVTSSGVVTQPEEDHTPDPGQLCYVTGAMGGSPSAHDVDGGPSHLYSPVFDLEGRDAIVSYWRWFHISVQMDDALVVAISNDSANWTTVEDVVRSAQEWAYAEWRVSDFVAPTSMIHVRFTVNDTDPGSVMEALIDDFAVRILSCQEPLAGDMNCDGVIDGQDVQGFVLALIDPAGYASTYPDCTFLNADVNLDGATDLQDLDGFVQLLINE